MKSNSHRRIIATLVMLGDAYVPGAIVLAASARMRLRTGSNERSDNERGDNERGDNERSGTFELWCMYTHDVSAGALRALEQVFDRVVLVPYISHACTRMRSVKQESIYGDWIAHSFTKWNILDDNVFPHGSTVMLLDADMIIADMVDGGGNDLLSIFDMVDGGSSGSADGAATFSSPWCRPYTRTRMKSPYKYAHGDTARECDIARGLRESITAIASMVVVHPRAEHFQRMLQLLNQRRVYGHTGCVSGHDEQLLADLILCEHLRFRHIHPAYNWLVGKDAWRESMPARTLHYYNVKPWNKCTIDWPDEREWWRVASKIETVQQMCKQAYQSAYTPAYTPAHIPAHQYARTPARTQVSALAFAHTPAHSFALAPPWITPDFSTLPDSQSSTSTANMDPSLTTKMDE